MQIYIGQEKYNFTKENLAYMYLDEGKEATVYRLSSRILKIYKTRPEKATLGYDTAAILSKIPTTNYLLPQEPIYDKDKNFDGYTSTYKEKHSLSFLGKVSLQAFIKELETLIKDTYLLSENGIDIYDLNYHNTIYDGHILICDPGSFMKVYNIDKKTLSEENKKKLNDYIIEEILPNIIELSRKKKQMIRAMSSSYDILEEVKKDNSKTVGAFIKKMTR